VWGLVWDMCCMSLGSTPFLLDNLHSKMRQLHRCTMPSWEELGDRHRCRHKE